MKKIIIIIAFLGAINVLFAQNKLSGNITDQTTREPLIGAAVYITDLKTGVAADSNGEYSFDNLKNGTYLLEVTAIGYQTVVQNITITESGTKLDFSLSTTVKELTEVIVTGLNRATELRQSPIITTSLDKNTLNQGSATNLIDALKNVPGMDQITTGGAISKPVIRGLGYNRIITLNNGVKQEGQQWGDEHGIEIDEYDVERVEIVKGPGSLMYGSDGIAGVLNFISAKPQPLGKIKTQISTNYQTNNNLVGYSLMNAGNKNGLQWQGRFSSKQAGNYMNSYDNKIYNSGFNEYNGSLFLGVNKSWGHSHLFVSTFNTTLNLVEGERDSLGKFIYTTPDGNTATATDADMRGYTTGFPHQKINHLRVSSNNYYLLDKGSLNLDLAFQNNKRREFGDATQPNDAELFFDLNTINYNARYNLEERHGWRTSTGVGGMYQTNTNRSLEFLIPNYNLFDAGAFVFTQKTFKNKISVAGGLRIDNRQIIGQQLVLDTLGAPSLTENSTTTRKFTAFTQNYSGISGSIGGSYQINNSSTLKINLSRGFRAPNIAEIASNGRHEGTFRYEYGEKDLRAEQSHQIDLAYSLNTEHVRLDFTPFINQIDNFIYAQKLNSTSGGDSIPDPADPAPAFRFTQGKATLWGGEVYLDIHPHPLDWLHIENSFSWVNATQTAQTDSTRYLPFTPAPRYRAVLKAEFAQPNKWLSNTYFKIGIDHYFAQNQFFAAYGTETATPAYTLLSAGIGTSLKAFGKTDGISLFLSGENLADIAYQSHLSRLKYAPQNPLTGRNGVFNMGRNVSLKVIFTI